MSLNTVACKHNICLYSTTQSKNLFFSFIFFFFCSNSVYHKCQGNIKEMLVFSNLYYTIVQLQHTLYMRQDIT